MADSLDSTRLTLREGASQRPHGAWWPKNRKLAEQLTLLFDLWPREQGQIARVLYSSPDWDDRPHAVEVVGRRVKTGTFPRDDTHELTLVLHDGQRRFLTVIPPGTSRRVATKALDAMAAMRSGAEQLPTSTNNESIQQQSDPS